MEILLTITYSLLFIFIINKWNFFSIQGVSRKSIIAVFIVKVFFGVLLGLIYTYYYTSRADADIYKYFDDSKILFSAFFTHPKHFFQMLSGIDSDADNLHPYYQTMNNWYNRYNVYNDNRTMIKLNAILRFVSFGHYYVHSVFMCFLSLIGLTGILKVFNAILVNKSKILFAIVFLIPSVLFWTSGMIKDGLLVFAFGVLFYNFHKLLKNDFSVKTLAAILFSFYLLTLIKLYVLLIIFPGLIAYYWSYKTNLKWVGLKFALIYFIAMVALFNIEKVLPQYNFKESLSDKQHNFIAISKVTKIGSFIDIQLIEPNTISILKAVPSAIANLLFRPYLSEARSPFILLAAVENVAILLMIALCILSYNPANKIRESLFYFSIYFVVLLYALTGLVTPIMGAFVRYKVPALPFLLVIFVFMFDQETLLKRIPLLGKLVNKILNTNLSKSK